MLANRALYFRRRLANGIFITLSVGAALFGLVWLTFILGGLLWGVAVVLAGYFAGESFGRVEKVVGKVGAGVLAVLVIAALVPRRTRFGWHALATVVIAVFVITFIVLACAQLMLRRMERSKGH